LDAAERLQAWFADADRDLEALEVDGDLAGFATG
jgi:hypothetical protein